MLRRQISLLGKNTVAEELTLEYFVHSVSEFILNKRTILANIIQQRIDSVRHPCSIFLNLQRFRPYFGNDISFRGYFEHMIIGLFLQNAMGYFSPWSGTFIPIPFFMLINDRLISDVITLYARRRRSFDDDTKQFADQALSILVIIAILFPGICEDDWRIVLVESR